MGIVTVNGIDLAYEIHGDDDGLPLLMIGGLGQQLVGWHPDLLAALARRGYRAIVFDNRDVGLSTHLDHLGRPDLGAIIAGRFDLAPYGLADLATDALGLLTALGVESAHLLGLSMGGMVAQIAALRSPERVRSLTSVMSHPGDHRVQPTPEAIGLFLRPAPEDVEQSVLAAHEAHRVLGSPEFAPDEAWLRRRAEIYWDRRASPDGVLRQVAAVLSAPDRTAELAGLRPPTLVVHGGADPLVPVIGGRLTAAAIPAAELLEIDGMGHDLPRQVWDRVLDKLEDVVDRGEAPRRPLAAAS
ncbi:putative hydrolase or acyltransferase of alpha/beta superfamily [Frankia torreyi]|uniref:Putative hydrolase or acyltransferase of alpha/beta superfamily n=2 Tax=Frankia TaxID=1854 RepID=A0A0D8BLK4_9ACTN|nr:MULTISPECIES: alpha/beta hydrolase [Frankia]KJE25001.1 putative hydrolase or acyltransferase of alpha/beta superfamily [Frankia torreyi]KQC39743.1 alpha/beta hydrolase [Frankia sp. ACN1ag]